MQGIWGTMHNASTYIDIGTSFKYLEPVEYPVLFSKVDKHFIEKILNWIKYR